MVAMTAGARSRRQDQGDAFVDQLRPTVDEIGVMNRAAARLNWHD